MRFGSGIVSSWNAGASFRTAGFSTTSSFLSVYSQLPNEKHFGHWNRQSHSFGKRTAGVRLTMSGSKSCGQTGFSRSLASRTMDLTCPSEKTICRGFWSKRRCSPAPPIMTTCGLKLRSTKKVRIGRPVFGDGTLWPDQNFWRSAALCSKVSFIAGDYRGR